jgi:AcrR family transcriptional regulator
VPKQVDHEERRDQIARALWRVATTRGLQAVSFREVAAEAGVSVNLVQHYFGTKAELLVWSVDHNTDRMARRIGERLAAVGEASATDTLRAVAVAFLPDDDESREAMLVYHAFAAAALTDETLRSGAGFDNEAALRAQLARWFADAGVDGDPDTQARILLSLILGLSLAVLLERMTVVDAVEAIDVHLGTVIRT